MRLICTLLVALGLFSVGLALGAGETVSVSAFPCAGGKPLRTSGVLIRFREKTYVLTSQLGVLENGVGSCHAIARQGESASRPARLIRADWGSGLALLEAPGETGGIEVEKLPQEPPPAGAPLQLRGFSAEGQFVAETVKLVQPASTRHSIPLVATTMEVTAPSLESASLVGGPIFGESFAGLVSHQFLRLVPGGRSRLVEWSRITAEHPARSSAARLLVLPLGAIQAWLAQGAPSPGFLQDDEAKRMGLDRVQAGALIVETHCPPETGDAHGIGPIGGGDGVGIGGEEPGTPSCTATLRLAPSPLAWPFPERREWHDRMVAELRAGRAYEMLYLAYREPAAQKLLRANFWMTSQFFKLLTGKELEPILAWTNEPAPPEGSESYRQLRAKNRETMDFASSRYDGFADVPDAQIILKRAYFLNHVLASPAWRLATGKDIHDAAGEDPDLGVAWMNFRAIAPRDAQTLSDQLAALEELRYRLKEGR